MRADIKRARAPPITSGMPTSRCLLPVFLVTLAVAAVPVLGGPASAQATEVGVNFSNVPSPSSPAANDRAFDQALDLHASWVRMFMSWNAIEPARGQYDEAWLSRWEDVLSQAKARGLKVDVVFVQAPAWAADSNGAPHDTQAFAEFLRTVTSRFAGKIAAYEIWNEEDEGEFWPGGKDGAAAPAYTQLLQAAYGAVKVADASATVLLGGLVGNDAAFLQKVYDNGGKGAFDGVAVHTDTACNLVSPSSYFRDPDGRISRWSFTGYREVRQTMLDHGEDKPVWMTELGWSTTTKTCDTGMWAGKKAGGVSEANQARFLTEAYQCLAGDSYVRVGLWFNLEDYAVPDLAVNRFGLTRTDLSHKPSYAAFKSLGSTGHADAACGGRVDTTPPHVEIVRPATGDVYVADLPIEAAASDASGLRRIELLMDGKHIRNFDHATTAYMDYQGAKRLPLGDHTVTVKATDAANHTTVVNVGVRKVALSDLGPFTTTTAGTLRTRRHSRRVTVSGRVTASGTAIRIPGKVRVDFAKRVHGHWRTAHKYGRNASRSFTMTVALERAKWRMRVHYIGATPFRASRARTIYFSVPAAHTRTYGKAKKRAAKRTRR